MPIPNPTPFHRGCDADDFFSNWFDNENLCKGATFSEPMRHPLSGAATQGRIHALIRLYGFKEPLDTTGTYMPDYQKAFQQERIDFHARPDLKNRKDI
jgi:hypothetical protein